ncbi:ABC transporter family protein [Bacillus atrophaeus]|nr:ABC transporter family protein [Bacillus atrophaeus]
MSTLLEVQNLKTYFFRKKQPIPAVDGVDFHINKGETVALVGESGSGKSITSLSIMGLVQSSGGQIMDGSITLEGKDLVTYTENDYCKIRGNDVSMIFQEPMTSLNPVLTIGEQITEVLIYHKNMNKKEARKRAIELLQMVGFSRAEQIMKDYPTVCQAE